MALPRDHLLDELASAYVQTTWSSLAPLSRFLTTCSWSASIRPRLVYLLSTNARSIVNASAFWWAERGSRTENTATVRIEISLANRL